MPWMMPTASATAAVVARLPSPLQRATARLPNPLQSATARLPHPLQSAAASAAEIAHLPGGFVNLPLEIDAAC